MTEAVFSEENVSVDIHIIIDIQRITGIQYLMNFRLKVMSLSKCLWFEVFLPEKVN